MYSYTGVGCVCGCAYTFCRGCREGLTTERTFRCMGLGGRMGLGGTESRRRQGWWCSLEAGFSPAAQLAESAPEQWNHLNQQLAGAWMEGGGAQDMPGGVESGLWGGPDWKTVPHLFFQLMWFAPGHM